MALQEHYQKKGGDSPMSTMGVEGLLEVKKWVMENNNHNPHMKFYLDIREDLLLSIHVVFFKRKRITDETEDEIYRAIRILSHQKLFPERNGNLRDGILIMHANYIHRHQVAKDIIRALNYIREDMPKIIQGK